MNILEIVSGADINGAVIHCLLLARQLTRRGHRVTLLCRHNAQILRHLGSEPIEVIESDLRRWPLTELKRLATITQAQKIDIIHTHMTRAHNFGVFLRRFTGVPCVATAHSHLIQLHWMFADHILAVSEATRQFHLRHNLVRPERIETIHGFMDYARFADVPEGCRSDVRAELGLCETTPLLGIIGDIIPRKGQIHLIRALPRIVLALPDARLLVVGDPKRRIGPKYRAELIAEAERLGVASRIHWAGQRNDVPRLLRALDLFVMASLEEMFPVAVLEAMASGLPIVATEVGGVPECVEPEKTALLVPRADSEALGKAIVRLFCDEERRRQMGAHAQQVARAQFTAESQTPKIEAAFARVIRRAKG